MLIDGVLLAVAAGWLCGGRIAGLTQVSLRWFWLIPTALLLRTGPAYLSGFGIDSALRFGPMSQLIGYLLLFAVLYLNRDLPGLKLLALGVVLNFAVIAANQGRMPVSPWSLSVVGMMGALPVLQNGGIATHGALTDTTLLWWLADIIPIPRPYPLPKIISIGDIVMVLGLTKLIMQSMMRDTRNQTPDTGGTAVGD